MALAMVSVEVCRRIPAGREEVWRVYSDYESWSTWAGIGRVRLARQGTGNRNGVGCLRRISTGGVSVDEEIVEFDPPRHLAYRVVRGGIPIKNHLGEVDFEEEEGGTRVRWRCRFDSRVPGLGFLWRAIVGLVFRRVLSALERYPFGKAGAQA